jgi:hypothetical protein
MHTGV